MRELVFIHGRSQQARNPDELKREWIDTWKKGLSENGLDLPIPEDHIRFPYYGDALDGLVRRVPQDQLPEVVVRSHEEDPQQREFVADVLEEVLKKKGISEAQVEVETAVRSGPRMGTRGILNWGWVQGLLTAIDRHVPFGSGASIALVTKDVYEYLNKPGTRDAIEIGVRKAMSPGVESIVVSHSLGTVVAYSMLRREGESLGWKVPLFVTLGSPLAVTKIRESLAPHQHPRCVGAWFNVMDPDDVVSLYPLDGQHFPVDPRIENKTDVDNKTQNQHGITGYLNDKVVAKRIYDALVA